MARVCHFCGGSLAGNKSREHVFADWLLEFTGQGDAIVEPTHQNFEGDVVYHRRNPHTFNGLLLGGVCERPCNNGWMSTIDANAKPALIALWQGRAAASLLQHDRHALSVWAAKTTFTLNLSSLSTFRRIIPQAHIEALFKNPKVLPPGVLVIAETGLKNDGLGWAQSQSWYAHLEDRETALCKALEGSSFKTTLRIGPSAVTTSFWPNDDWMISLRDGRHVMMGSERSLIGWNAAPGYVKSNYDHVEHAFEIQVLSPATVRAQYGDAPFGVP
ncbi:MAG: hypothetical protein HYS27_22750 [Deltaproteobacteria bacterium]|nr:hypothetical protein [Deltaproteobacteria bacterium]